MGALVIPNQFTMSSDLVNLGLKCHDCDSRHIVYCITQASQFYPLGSYCYKCLLNRCKATRRKRYNTIVPEYMIPTPMDWNIFASLKVDLGLETTKQNAVF